MTTDNLAAIDNRRASLFVSYLIQVHRRIHPIFSDTFLDSLDSLPRSNAMNDPNLVTRLEIVIEKTDGRLARLGVVHPSGATMFDINVLAAILRAAPFGAPPPEIVSPDGNVYLHWEFRRDQMACSTLYAHPYILKVQPKPAPLPGGAPLPPFRGPDDEVPPPSNERHGMTEPSPQKRATPPG